MRIVSLLPSATEIVNALGLSAHLVARSHECDYPKSILRLPACTAREIEINESTPGIQLRATEPNYCALSVLSIDWDLLRGLRPTHILTQTLCAEYRISREDILRVLEKELFDLPELVSLHARTLQAVLEDFRRVGDALGHPEEAASLVRETSQRIDAISVRARRSMQRPLRVACLDWIQPPMLGGHWLPELVRLAGAIPAGEPAPENSNRIGWEYLGSINPDVIIVMPCGYRLPEALTELGHVARRPEWQTLKAVREGKVYVANGSDYFNRPGPRLLDSLEVLTEILVPNEFPGHHEGSAWLPFPVAP